MISIGKLQNKKNGLNRPLIHFSDGQSSRGVHDTKVRATDVRATNVRATNVRATNVRA